MFKKHKGIHKQAVIQKKRDCKTHRIRELKVGKKINKKRIKKVCEK